MSSEKSEPPAYYEDGEEIAYTTDFSKDENEERGNWTGRMDYLLSCLGYAVGLGNVWRFPYLCYKNGGAAFFIPYCIMLFFVGMPIFYLETALGQYTSQGPFTCWKYAPMFSGIGVGMVVVSMGVALYYNMIIAWSLYYLSVSFTSNLPWVECGDWASEWCSKKLDANNITSGTACTARGYTYNATSTVCYGVNSTPMAIVNKSIAREYNIKPVTPTEDYLNRVVWKSHLADGISDLGPLHWDLALALLGAWFIVYVSLIKGIKSSGKVVYFTALFPYVVLIILCIRGAMLDGHMDGIRFYILDVKWEKLSDAQVWKDAAVQIFFSLSASWGGLIALASYNRFHNDCLRDTIIVSMGNCLTSFFAGFVIFSFLGFLAKETGVKVEDVATSGVGLAFVVYPDAVTRLPGATIWAIIFFIMLITLGLDSQFAMIETTTTAFNDIFPITRKHKSLFLLLICVCGYCIGLVMCTSGGSYVLSLLDAFMGGWNLLVLALVEVISVCWVYGFRNFSQDIQCMLGSYGCCCLPWKCCQYWWAAMWYIFTPLGLLFILIFSWIDYSPYKDGDYLYPEWANGIGMGLTCFIVFLLILTGIIMILIQPGSCMEKLRRASSPTKEWGPMLKKHRRLVQHIPGFVVDTKNDTAPIIQDSGYPMQDKAGQSYDNAAYQNQI